jgi:hypothetical protein
VQERNSTYDFSGVSRFLSLKQIGIFAKDPLSEVHKASMKGSLVSRSPRDRADWANSAFKSGLMKDDLGLN